MKHTIHPSRIEGALPAPPSKSVMLRTIAAALLAEDPVSRILGPSLCGDARSGLRVAEGLGATVAIAPDAVSIRPGRAAVARVLDCGESALCLRMFVPIAALCGEEVTLTGRRSLLRRPTTNVAEPLAALGGFARTAGGYPPVTVRGPLSGGKAAVDGAVSSQFLSGLLIALPTLPSDTTLDVHRLTSRPYVDLTIRLLAGFGVGIEREGYERFHVPGNQRPRVGEARVEGDWSAAAFLLALGAVGGSIRVTGLDPESAQADRRILDILSDAGANVVRHPDGARVERGGIRAIRLDATDCPDLLPPLAALACHAEGTSVFRGVDRLRTKECDRGRVLARELAGLGARIELDGNEMEIRGGSLRGGRGDAHGDHRIAMALAVAAVGARGPVVVSGTEHVAKSYPGFFTDLASVGGAILLERPVASRAAGSKA